MLLLLDPLLLLLAEDLQLLLLMEPLPNFLVRPRLLLRLVHALAAALVGPQRAARRVKCRLCLCGRFPQRRAAVHARRQLLSLWRLGRRCRGHALRGHVMPAHDAVGRRKLLRWHQDSPVRAGAGPRCGFLPVVGRRKCVFGRGVRLGESRWLLLLG